VKIVRVSSASENEKRSRALARFTFERGGEREREGQKREEVESRRVERTMKGVITRICSWKAQSRLDPVLTGPSREEEQNNEYNLTIR
jgi:hypothetical protein